MISVGMVSALPPPTGGITLWTERTLQELSGSERVRLQVVNTRPSARRTATSSLLQRLVEGGPRLVSELARLTAMLIRLRPDVVHLNTSGGLAFVRDHLVLSAAWMSRKPVVVHIRFGRLPELEQSGGWEWALGRTVMRRAQRVIALDAATYEVAGRLSVPAVMLPNFVSVPADHVEGDRRPYFLFAGWLVQTKGILDLLDAWGEGHEPGWKLKIAGRLGSDPVVLERLASLPEDVELLGELARDELLRLMLECGCLVLPSWTEGFPNVIAEAMAAGAPIIATSVGAIPEMLRDGAGVIVEPRRPQELCDAMQRLSGDATLRASLGEAAWHRCSANYSTEVVLSQLVALWEELSGREPLDGSS